MASVALLVAWAGPAAGADDGQERGQRKAGAGALYAEIEVKGAIPDAEPLVYLFEPAGEALYGLLDRLDAAAQDQSVRGVVLRVQDFGAGFAKVQELRQALARCRQAGKEVVCYLDSAGNLSYYLATGADRIVLAPSTHLMLVGVRAEIIFARRLLDKVGVEADFVQAGRYKSAGEWLTREGPSQASRESIESIVEDYFDQLTEGIARGRGMPISAAVAAARHGPYTAEEARRRGLVDDVMFYDELVKDLRTGDDGRAEMRPEYGRAKARAAGRPGSPNFFSLLMGGALPARKGPASPCIAVVHAVGAIVSGSAEDLGMGSRVVAADDFVRVLRVARDDANVKAIVVRIESPGGSASASDAIWRELRRADARKPVIASMSDVAASGGYYMAAGARRIYAEPATVTGSIGVFGGKLVLTDLLDKLGLDVYVVERGGSTGLASPFVPFSPQERRKMKDLLEDVYRTFLNRVAQTRPGMSVAQVEAVAQGRVWTGRQALANGLVDELGGLTEAIAAARGAAGIPPEQRVVVQHLPRSRSLIELVFLDPEAASGVRGGLRAAPFGQLTASVIPADVRAYVAALLRLRQEPALCMLPVLLRIR